MLSDEPAQFPGPSHPAPLWGTQPNGTQGQDADEDDWEEYELEEPSDEDEELDDDDEIEDWSEDD
ncbi:MAG TPA: hypothetical protein VGR57_16080, partial [Ktedonobacterales bacterium]|nr:hypothetical protein [Ktedonobacterales bacterium]